MAEATTVRVATMEDLEGFNALLKESGTMLQKLPSITFVAEARGKLVGALGFSWDNDYPVAGPLMISPSAKGRKRLVHRLISAMEDWIARAGVTRYLFEIDSDNGPMLQVAESSGARRYALEATTIWYVKEVGIHGLRAAS